MSSPVRHLSEDGGLVISEGQRRIPWEKGQRQRWVSESTRSEKTVHTQDFDEQTRAAGGWEFAYKYRVADTTALYKKREEEEGAAESGTTADR